MSNKSRSQPTVFTGIRELLTLSGAAQKAGRRVNTDDLNAIADACIVERNGVIEWVGRRTRLPTEFRGRAIRRVDLDVACVLPAFVEAHAHLAFAGNRAEEFELRCQGAGYQEIAKAGGGILSTMRKTRAATRAQLRAGAQARADRFVRQGVATLEAKSGYGLDAASEIKALEALGQVRGPRIVRTFLGAHAQPPEAQDAATHLKNMADLLPEIRRRKLATRVDAFVEKGYFEPALVEAYFRKAQELGFDIAVHADQLRRGGGAKLAARIGARSAEHLVCIDKGDIRALAQSETTCVLLPTADLYMDCRYPPARALIDAGARIALATDLNPGSSPTQDLALVGVLARVKMKMTLAESIAAYTIGGAYALGFGDSLGALCTGRRCDFVALSSTWRELFYAVGESSAVATYRDGRLIK